MINGSIRQRAAVSGGITAGGGGTNDYTELENKPAINGNTLEGDKTAYELGLVDFNHLPHYQLIKHTLYKTTSFVGAPVLTNVNYDNDYKLSDYDFIIINYCDESDAKIFGSSVLDTSDGDKGIYYCGYGHRVNYTIFYDTYFNTQRAEAVGEFGGYAPRVYSIIGIKLGAVV